MPASDLFVYAGRGGEEAAILCACAGADRGLIVDLVVDGNRIGGMTAGGLANQDRGNPARRLRGLLLKWEQMLGWKIGTTFTLFGRPGRCELVFHEMIGQAGRKSGGRVRLWLNERLAAVTRVDPNGLTQATMVSGKVFTALTYVDGSRCLKMVQKVGAQGELWRIGRESAATYGESFAGYGYVRTLVNASPFIPGTSTPLVGMSPDPGTAIGAADAGCQAPMYRAVVSNDELSKIAWDHRLIDLTTYNRDEHMLYALSVDTSPEGRMRGTGIDAGLNAINGDQYLTKSDGTPLHWDYDLISEEDQIAREALYKRNLQHSFYFVATDPMFAGTAIQADYQNNWGWPRDEMQPDGFPWTFYRRSGVRFIGNTTLALQDLQVTDMSAPRNIYKLDCVAIGGYSADHHPYQVHRNGSSTVNFWREGNAPDAQKQTNAQGYAIPFSSLVNSLVPNFACAWPSCSNVAAGSIRIIPNLILAGIAIAYAAALAKSLGKAIAALNASDIVTLQGLLSADGYRVTIGPWAADPDPDDPDNPDDGSGEGEGGGG